MKSHKAKLSAIHISGMKLGARALLGESGLTGEDYETYLGWDSGCKPLVQWSAG
jgi:hypothetical protein